jgi:hypothetical protein
MRIARRLSCWLRPRIEPVPVEGADDTAESYVVVTPHWPPLLVSVVF